MRHPNPAAASERHHRREKSVTLPAPANHAAELHGIQGEVRALTGHFPPSAGGTDQLEHERLAVPARPFLDHIGDTQNR